jgi:hypothetical protein
MPSTFTTRLRFTLEAAGENLNTWGTILNTGVFQLVDDTVAGYATIVLSGPVTLTTANGTADQARLAYLNFTGTGGTVTIPSQSKVYQITNNTTGNAVITTGGGTTATLATLDSATVMCDGTNCYRMTTPSDIAACLATAEAYTDAAAFASSSGNLPAQAGNAGKFLITNGTLANWANVGNITGNAPTATLATNATAWSSPRNLVLGGDLTGSFAGVDGSANVTATAALATVNSNVGSFTNANLTVNAKGLVTAASSSAASGGFVGVNGPKTTAYTTVLSDANKIIWINPGSNMTVTIPSNASVPYPVSTVIRFIGQSSSHNVLVGVSSDTFLGGIALSGPTGPWMADMVKIAATTWYGQVYAVG